MSRLFSWPFLVFQVSAVLDLLSLSLTHRSLSSVVDAYRLEMTYSPLVLSGMISALAAILLSIIPKRWFDPGEAMRMKQALGLGNKDPTVAGVNGNLSALGGTSSAFEEIRAQRRIRNALLYNQMKT